MGWDVVVERFLKRSPLTVMAHLTLRRALAAPWLDALFAEHAERQYVRSLLFSTVVDLLASVTFGFRPSIHAAVKAAGATLPVSLTALYEDQPDGARLGPGDGPRGGAATCRPAVVLAAGPRALGRANAGR